MTEVPGHHDGLQADERAGDACTDRQDRAGDLVTEHAGSLTPRRSVPSMTRTSWCEKPHASTRRSTSPASGAGSGSSASRRSGLGARHLQHDRPHDRAPTRAEPVSTSGGGETGGTACMSTILLPSRGAAHAGGERLPGPTGTVLTNSAEEPGRTARRDGTHHHRGGTAVGQRFDRRAPDVPHVESLLRGPGAPVGAPRLRRPDGGGPPPDCARRPLARRAALRDNGPSPSPWEVRIVRIGAHVSGAGGLDRAIDRALEIGAECVQLFPSSPQGWGFKAPDELAAAEFKRKALECDVGPNVFPRHLSRQPRRRRPRARSAGEVVAGQVPERRRGDGR